MKRSLKTGERSFTAPLTKITKLAKGYRSHGDNQIVCIAAQPVGDLFRWKHEAERLLGLYWRAGKVCYLRAFNVHVAGMRARLIGGLQ